MRRILLVFIYVAIFPLWAECVEVQKSILSVRESTHFKVLPRAVFNSKTTNILVVWEKHPGNHPDHSIWGRLINAQGKPAGPEFVIVNGPNTYGPSVTYNAQRNEFALAYANELSGQAVFALFVQRLNSQGRRIGTPVRITSEQEASASVVNQRPFILWDSKTGNCLLFWQKEKLSTSTATVAEGLYGMTLNATLAPVKAATLIRAAKPDGQFTIIPFVTDAVIHPITGRVLLGYYEFAPGFGTGIPKEIITVANLDPSLNSIQPSNFSKVKQGSVVGGFDLKLNMMPDGNGFVVFTDSNNVKFRKIDISGKLVGPLTPAFRTPLNNIKLSFLSVAQSNGAKGIKTIVTGVRDSQNTTGQIGNWAQVFDATGRPSGSPVFLDAPSDRASGSSLAAAATTLTSVNYRFILVYGEGAQLNIPPTSSESSGLILLNLNFTFP